MGASDFANLPHIGDALRRKEDYRFLTGAGNYTDDITLANQSHAVFVRSPHAHARVVSVDIADALTMPGVVGIFSGKDIEGKMGGLPCGWLINNPDGTPMKEPMHPILAINKVRYVGDHVAMVVAETVEQAKNAAEAVVVEYEVLPALVGVADAAKKAGGVTIHDEAPDNQCYKWALGDKAAVDAAFAGAAHVTKLDLVNNRLIPNPIEPRVAIGSYSRGVCLTWAAKQLNRNIKWTAERSECFLSDAHGRDHVSHAEMAMDKDGKFLAMRVHTDANLGAYLSTFSTAVPTILYATLLAGQYTTPQIYVEVDAWFTNTAPVDAYRGAGRPEATYLLERLVSRCAWEMNLGQDEIRQRNFITAFPYQTPVALQYDTGDFHACMDKARKLAEVEGYGQRKSASEAAGKLRGIGYSSYIEACGIAPSNIAGALGARAGLFECGEIRVHPTGSVTVFTGSHSHGQGHETTFAQVVAARLGIAVEAVDVVHGDTGRVPFGMGTYGSRSISVGGAAIMKALDKIEAKAKKIAAHLMEASDADIEFANGEFTVKLVQGIGQALLENCVYDNETGQLLTGSFMDYAMPRAAEFPQFKLDTVCTPCTHNPLGTKGCGEAGAIGSPPAVINAVLDALAPLGVKDFDMPASSSRVWEAMQKGSGSAASDPVAQQPALAASTQGRPAA